MNVTGWMGARVPFFFLSPWGWRLLSAIRFSIAGSDSAENLGSQPCLVSISLAATIGGLYAIWKNKENNAAAKGLVAKHLVSQHGKLGALTGTWPPTYGGRMIHVLPPC